MLSLSLVSLCGDHIFSNLHNFGPSLRRDMLTSWKLSKYKISLQFQRSRKNNIGNWKQSVCSCMQTSISDTVGCRPWNFYFGTWLIWNKYCMCIMRLLPVVYILHWHCFISGFVLLLLCVSVGRNIICYSGFSDLKFLPLWIIALIVCNCCSLFSEVL